MNLDEITAMAMRLSPADRRLLAYRLIPSVDPSDLAALLEPDDPILRFVASWTEGGFPAWSSRGEGPIDVFDETGTPIEEDPLWVLGRNPVDCGITDGSVNHDRYFCDDRLRVDRATTSRRPTA